MKRIKPTHHTIPNTIHLIWFGSMLPKNNEYPYQNHVIGQKALNPEFNVNLWTSSDSMSKKEYQKMVEFCSKYKIQIHDLAHKKYSMLSNLEHINLELKRGNWARASDIARLSILLQCGGYYLDTDLKPKAALRKNYPSIYGMNHFIAEDDQDHTLNIYFLAAIPQHPFFLAAIKYLDHVYNMVKEDKKSTLYPGQNHTLLIS